MAPDTGGLLAPLLLVRALKLMGLASLTGGSGRSFAVENCLLAGLRGLMGLNDLGGAC